MCIRKVQKSGGKMARGHKKSSTGRETSFKHMEGWITLLIPGDVHIIILWRNCSLELLKFYNIFRENENANQ